MNEEDIKKLIEGSQMIVGLHVELFKNYMKMTNDNVELSINLARDGLNAMIGLGKNYKESE